MGKNESMRYSRKFLFGLLALGLFLSACTQTPEQRAKDATVLIIAADADGSIGNGSGFFVQPNKIATNIHVVAGKRMLFAVGTKEVYNIEKVAGYAPEHDLVILKISGKDKPLELGERQGDAVLAVGYPGGGCEVTEGKVHGIRKSDGQLRLVTKGFSEIGGSVLSPGNSGGPILNSEGKVIGIAVSGEEDFNFSYANAASVLDELLKSTKEENLSDWQNEKPIRAHALSTVGKELLISENDEEAVKFFDKALKLYKYADPYEKMGIAKQGLGRYQEAIQYYNEAIDLITDDFTAYYNRGFAKLESEDYIGAIQDCKKVIELNQDDAEVYLVQGPAKEATLDYIGAIKDYSEAIDNLNPKEPWNYYFYRGDAKRKIKDYAGAIDDYSKAIELKDDFVNAYLNRGIAKAGKPVHDYAGAIEDYGKIIVLAPKDSRAYYNRGNARQALGQDEDAKQDHAIAYYYWGKADSNSGNYQAAINNFDKANALVPNYAEAYHYLGDAYRLRGQKDDYQKAIENYDKVARLKPDYTEIHVVYNNRGLAKVAVANYDGAISDYTKATESESNYAQTYYNRGEVYRFQGQKDFQNAVENFEEAEKNYNTAIDLKPDFADAYHKRGLAKENLDKDDAAKLDFVMAYYFWGLEAYKREQYQKAIKNFDESLELEPNFDFVYYYRGGTKAELGKSKTDLGDSEEARDLYQEAIKDHDEAIRLDPEEAEYYRIRGVTKFRRAAIRDYNDHNGMIEDYESAIEDFTKTSKRKSDFMQKSDFTGTYNLRGEARYLLGYAKANQGNTKEARKQYNLAREDFKKAIEEAPKNPAYYKGLGVANAALGKAKAALSAFEEAKRLETEYENK